MNLEREKLKNWALANKLKTKFGSLSMAAKELTMGYVRLSQIVNSMTIPNMDDIRKLIVIAGCDDTDFEYWRDDQRYDKFRMYLKAFKNDL